MSGRATTDCTSDAEVAEKKGGGVSNGAGEGVGVRGWRM